MTTLAVAIITALEELVKLSPSLIVDLQAIFSKPDPTTADWQALKDRVMSKSYSDYVPASDLPSDPTKPDV
jgi:hypothetical protein